MKKYFILRHLLIVFITTSIYATSSVQKIQERYHKKLARLIKKNKILREELTAKAFSTHLSHVHVTYEKKNEKKAAGITIIYAKPDGTHFLLHSDLTLLITKLPKTFFNAELNDLNDAWINTLNLLNIEEFEGRIGAFTYELELDSAQEEDQKLIQELETNIKKITTVVNILVELEKEPVLIEVGSLISIEELSQDLKNLSITLNFLIEKISGY